MKKAYMLYWVRPGEVEQEVEVRWFNSYRQALGVNNYNLDLSDTSLVVRRVPELDNRYNEWQDLRFRGVWYLNAGYTITGWRLPNGFTYEFNIPLSRDSIIKDLFGDDDESLYASPIYAEMVDSQVDLHGHLFKPKRGKVQAYTL